MSNLNESHIEEAALEWFAGLRYSYRLGAQIAPGEPGAERDSYEKVLLEHRLRDTIGRMRWFVRFGALDNPIRDRINLGYLARRSA